MKIKLSENAPSPVIHASTCSACGSKEVVFSQSRDFDYGPYVSLKGIYVDGIEIFRCSACGNQDIGIFSLSSLHRVIARQILWETTESLTGKELRMVKYTLAEPADCPDYWEVVD